mgnify:CR=1 FL=1
MVGKKGYQEFHGLIILNFGGSKFQKMEGLFQQFLLEKMSNASLQKFVKGIDIHNLPVFLKKWLKMVRESLTLVSSCHFTTP